MSIGDVTAANVDAFDAAAETSAVSSGQASNTTLTTGNDTVVGTADFVDVVTGTVGTGATYGVAGTNIDSISDSGSGDGDTLTLSGDGAPAALSGITGFETINLNLAKQSDSTAFAITSVGNDVDTLNIELRP